MSHQFLRSSVFTGLLGISLALNPLAAGQDQKGAKETPKPAPAGMVAVKDPVTGKLRPPTAEEAAELNRSTKKVQPQHKLAEQKPQTVRGPGGSVGVVLDESSTIFAVATKNADGKVTTKETTGATLAKKPGQEGKTNEK